ncbi:MAG: SpoIVB peptidase, partial [Clostridia bacterium]|nr:SpoIVB peptidase [Clostridia bacterium]
RTVAQILSLILALCLWGGFGTSLGERGVMWNPLASGEAMAFSRDRYLLPGGMPFGIQMETDGVVVVGFAKTQSGAPSPAQSAGIVPGDVIKKLNGKTLANARELIALIEASDGRELNLTLERGGKTLIKTLIAKRDAEGCYRAGLKVRDTTAGIGTVTAIDPETMTFVGLGHGICDSDTGILLPLKCGTVFDVSVSSIRKGVQGAPGEIKGYFSSDECGTLLQNAAFGVSGKFTGKCFDHSKPMAVASRDEVTLGKATVLCTLGDNVRREYEISLVKMTNPKGDEKNFIVEVTDPALLAETGGIVQGMSGSPIIQNGKLIGAITHVMVGDPTRGYGIFIENMLHTAQMPMAKAS